MKNSKLNFLSIIGFLSILTIVLLSLPYPWCGLSSWLEAFISIVESCACVCPWWLFSIGQIISSYFLFLLAQSIKKHSRIKYVVLQILIGLIFYIFHIFIHNYYIGKQIYQASVFCPWMWLIGLIIGVIFSILPIYKPKERK